MIYKLSNMKYENNLKFSDEPFSKKKNPSLMYSNQCTVNRSLNIRVDLSTVHIVSKGPVLLRFTNNGL